MEVILDDLDRLLHRTVDRKRLSRHVTWYDAAFRPEVALNAMIEEGELRNGITATDVSRDFVAKIQTLTSMLKDSKCTDEVARLLGKGGLQTLFDNCSIVSRDSSNFQSLTSLAPSPQNISQRVSIQRFYSLYIPGSPAISYTQNPDSLIWANCP